MFNESPKDRAKSTKMLNYSRETVLAGKVEAADTWLARLRGLMFRDSLSPECCIVLHPCNSIHTCFMRFNIDVIFADRAGEVLYLLENMPPWRFSPIVTDAVLVVELPAGTLKASGTRVGDRITPLQEMAL